ncbi:hypothetical protein GCM10017778_55910 [Streptomyces vinaceus]|nr:hypothetical protein GCM10017778_55910 [Streptomyces vinaceus]
MGTGTTEPARAARVGEFTVEPRPGVGRPPPGSSSRGGHDDGAEREYVRRVRGRVVEGAGLCRAAPRQRVTGQPVVVTRT